MRFDPTRALIVYAGALTAIVGWPMLAGAGPAPTRFDAIDVGRINLRERDGTLRMVIAARDRFPGLILHGREQPHPGRTDSAGMIFYNDEGTENGGLIFGGKRTDGRVSNFGHLSFDQYEQDQVTTLAQSEDDGRRRGGITVADRPDTPLDMAAIRRLDGLGEAERTRTIAALLASGRFGRDRAYFGKDADRNALVDLRDAEGRTRLRLRVTAAGVAAIDFLDAGGRIVRTVDAGG